MDFNEKFEPRGSKILHGAGQSPSQFKKYWDISKNAKPVIYMEYVKFNEVKEKLTKKLQNIKETSNNLCLQLGLNLKPRNDKEKCKEISEGLYDEDLLFLIEQLVNFKNPVFLRIGYECNNPSHNYNTKYFKKAWIHIANLVNKNSSNISLVWCVCTAFNRDIKEILEYYPGDEYVNWIANDLFGLRHFKDNEDQVTENLCEFAKNHKKPMMIGECSPAKVGVEKGIQSSITTEDVTAVEKERDAIKKLVIEEKIQVQPSKEELKLNEDIEKLKKIDETWAELIEQKNKLSFFQVETDKFIQVCNDFSRLIQENISQRFKDISSLIGKYFGILRQDKDIKDIEIVLNLEKGRAAGRSAEIQLSYYNISVKPAYKVLSESLLNSLGLAIYFACVKQFNQKSRFIVLDDIMNSLDVGHRDTLLDLIEQEFPEHQIILFTHDLFWFEKIQMRFPSWITKKIKGWEYALGPKIDFAKTRKSEIDELLQDSTKVKQAGFLFSEHLEGVLNELCEDLHAEVRHRFVKHDLPSMEELFIADRKSTRLNSSHTDISRMPSSA